MFTLASDPPNFLKLLAHDLRWRLLEALARSDHRVQELVELSGRSQNLVSYHLRRLREARLVCERRSSHDARDVYYSLDLAHLQRLYASAGESLHPALDGRQSATHTGTIARSIAQQVRVIFLCTHNSARSQMAEGILRARGGDLVEVTSAGSEPRKVHTLAVRALAEIGIDISAQQSRHMEQFVCQHFDYIITVCDRVRETCPVFPDDPECIHWSFEDPAAVEGPQATRYRAFQKTAAELSTRVNYLLLMIKRDQG